ncbi:MAG: PaaI family thioesterase [Chloroflexi bacterium]|nr:PaaI family thioesterase [Chloroflexota bacterium]
MQHGSPASGTLSLQEALAPESVCFGCGPANPGGLHLRSFERGNEVVAEWQPEARYEAFPGALNGGIIGALLDCHSNWAAATALMRRTGADGVPATVTASYEVRLFRPTPTTAGPVSLQARVVDVREDRATVESTLVAGGQRCATFRGTFVAVRPGHPAFHRWERIADGTPRSEGSHADLG